MGKLFVTILTLSALLAGAVGCGPTQARVSLPPDRPQVIVPLIRAGDILLTRVTINGQDGGWWMIDTGSTINLVDDDLAEQLDLTAVGEREYLGLAGRQQLRIRRVESLRLGPAEVAGHQVGECDLQPFSEALGVPIGGLLSCQALSAMPVTLDYANRLMVLHQPGRFVPPAEAVAVELALAETTPHVTGGLLDDRPGLFLLDTGNTTAVDLNYHFYRDQTERLLGRNPGARPMRRFIGFGGEGYSVQTLPVALELFGQEIRGVTVEVNMPAPQAPATGRAGIVGGALLSRYRVTFDLQARRVYLEPADAAMVLRRASSVGDVGAVVR